MEIIHRIMFSTGQLNKNKNKKKPLFFFSHDSLRHSVLLLTDVIAIVAIEAPVGRNTSNQVGLETYRHFNFLYIIAWRRPCSRLFIYDINNSAGAKASASLTE